MKRDAEFLRDIGMSLIPPLALYAIYRVEMMIWPGWLEADIHLHLLGGTSIAWMAYILWRKWETRKWIPVLPYWLGAWTVLGTVAIIGIFWEFREWITDTYFPTSDIAQISLTETMSDFGMDLLGGMLFLPVARLFKKWRA